MYIYGFSQRLLREHIECCVKNQKEKRVENLSDSTLFFFFFIAETTFGKVKLMCTVCTAMCAMLWLDGNRAWSLHKYASQPNSRKWEEKNGLLTDQQRHK